MTREPSIQVLADGTTGRTVLLCHPEPVDPDPKATWDRGVTLLWVAPPAPGRWTETADEIAAALPQTAEAPIGAVGWSTGGLLAGSLAARHPALVDRLVLVATGAPPADPAPPFDPAGITTKTLLLYGAHDPLAGPRDGKWYQQRLPNRRYEQNPAQGPLLLSSMWPRALSHLAPNRRR